MDNESHMGEESKRILTIRKLFKELGGNPDDLFIGPSNDYLGVNYRVTKGDKEETILRKHLDDVADSQWQQIIERQLKSFL